MSLNKIVWSCPRLKCDRKRANSVKDVSPWNTNAMKTVL